METINVKVLKVGGKWQCEVLAVSNGKVDSAVWVDESPRQAYQGAMSIARRHVRWSVV